MKNQVRRVRLAARSLVCLLVCLRPRSQLPLLLLPLRCAAASPSSVAAGPIPEVLTNSHSVTIPIFLLLPICRSPYPFSCYFQLSLYRTIAVLMPYFCRAVPLTAMVRMGSMMMGPGAMSKGMFMPGRGVKMSLNRMTPSGLNACHGCREISTCEA